MSRTQRQRDNETIAEIPERSENPKAIADFIAHSRTDIPALRAALRESRERERRYEAALRGLVGRYTEALDAARAALGEERP